MELSITKDQLINYLVHQVNNLFPDNNLLEKKMLSEIIDHSIDRLDYCFSKVTNSRYKTNNKTFYNHLYSDHNIVFYWFIANTIWKRFSDNQYASKFYYLNKTMHGFDCMYDTQMPDIFLIFHGVGTMLGKAHYEDYFIAMQGCTVGANRGKYPIMGKGVSLTANSSIIGDCKIGNQCTIGTSTMLLDTELQDNHVAYYNTNGNIQTKLSKHIYSKNFFDF